MYIIYSDSVLVLVFAQRPLKAPPGVDPRSAGLGHHWPSISMRRGGARQSRSPARARSWAFHPRSLPRARDAARRRCRAARAKALAEEWESRAQTAPRVLCVPKPAAHPARSGLNYWWVKNCDVIRTNCERLLREFSGACGSVRGIVGGSRGGKDLGNGDTRSLG